MEIRKIRPQEVEAVRALCFTAFEAKIDFTASPKESADQILHRPLTRMHQNYLETWAAFNEENDPIATAAHCTLKARLDGSAVGLEGIGDVASLPQAQGKGTIRILFQNILKEAYEKGVELSGLYPFSDGYYARLGYANCVKNHVWQLCPGQIPSWKTEGICKPYAEGRGMEEHLEQIYEKAAKEYNLSLIRQQPEWNRQLKLFLPHRDGFYTYLYYSVFGEPTGYVSYQADHDSKTLECRQFFFTDADALKGLLLFLKGKAAYYNTVSIPLPCTVPLELLLSEFHLNAPHNPAYTLEMHGMTRIVHLRRALEAARFGPDGALRLAVSDPILEQNSGTFELEWKNGRLNKMEKTTQPADAEVSIAQLTRFLCAGLRQEELSLMPQISAQAALQLEKAFPPKKTTVFDYY